MQEAAKNFGEGIDARVVRVADYGGVCDIHVTVPCFDGDRDIDGFELHPAIAGQAAVYDGVHFRVVAQSFCDGIEHVGCRSVIL